MKSAQRPAEISLLKSVLLVLRHSPLRRPVLELIGTILKYFFWPQHRARFLPGRIPVSSVDHPLDGRIPFRPELAPVYLDFVPSWIRMAGFLLSRFGARAVPELREFILSMKALYRFAAQVYLVNFSTTDRPHYYGSFRFAVIHLTDPHLMCVPSLHVMIMIRAWTGLRAMLATLDTENECAPRLAGMLEKAVEITASVLFMKQHSLNCIPAALYAMRRFAPALFTAGDAAFFISRLCSSPGAPLPDPDYRDFIVARLQEFTEAGEKSATWEAPLLDFLRARRGRIEENGGPRQTAGRGRQGSGAEARAVIQSGMGDEG